MKTNINVKGKINSIPWLYLVLLQRHGTGDEREKIRRKVGGIFVLQDERNICKETKIKK